MQFLIKYQLNGALCDEMGLGKTIQTLSVIQNIHDVRADSISLIICPSSITHHWLNEIKMYVDSFLIKPMILDSFSPSIASQIQSRDINVLIVNYRNLVKFIEHLETIQFTFMILDEGHLIKNHKTKTAQSVKMIQAKHKFILTGTPI